MLRTLHGEHLFSDIFVAYLVQRHNQTQADLVDQLFNSSEKRLTRALLLLAHFGKETRPEEVTPNVSQETLAEMIGTTRSRVNFFMNKFRRLGFIEYNGGLRVRSSLLMLFFTSNLSTRRSGVPTDNHIQITQRYVDRASCPAHLVEYRRVATAAVTSVTICEKVFWLSGQVRTGTSCLVRSCFYYSSLLVRNIISYFLPALFRVIHRHYRAFCYARPRSFACVFQSLPT
jgi:Crp-like helix-turn-helix protein